MTSAFYPPHLLSIARENIAHHAWAREVRDKAISDAAPWARMPDEEIWALPFSPAMERSWMVWSDGFCPACRASVPMYAWQIDALKNPWKVRCPDCRRLFPENDFAAFYRSGVGPDGLFRAEQADRKLLYDQQHAGSSGGLHDICIDDGTGYKDGRGHHWRFIGAYLIYGQWKQLIVGGLTKLSEAWLLSGERVYAHKAAVLLDRIADLYPLYDFGEQGVLYEGRHAGSGYVSNWHDACEETRDLALAYDAICDGIADDAALVTFLSSKHPEGCDGVEDVHTHIRQGILQDALDNPDKIRSNWPARHITECIIHTALGWPANRHEVLERIDEIIRLGTSVDGLTGEKGLTAYSALGPQRLAVFLERYGRMEEGFLESVYMRHPRLHAMCRFYIDAHCLGRYYPHSGDGGTFARQDRRYLGAELTPEAGVTPGGWRFLYEMFRLTGDEALAQTLYHENGFSVQGLPYDLFTKDPARMQKHIESAVARSGSEPQPGSVNKSEWALAILRSGEGENQRALWLDYDSGGSHGHSDALTLGLFAKGLDLAPDFGYPPVQHGGWESEKALWYTSAAAHNTVVVDGKNQRPAHGATTLWADGQSLSAVCASVPEALDVHEPRPIFQRTAILVSVSASEFYVVDLFHVQGGRRHCLTLRSHFGELRGQGLSLKPSDPLWAGLPVRNTLTDPSASPGWSAEWMIEDRYGYLPAGADVRMRYSCCLPSEALSIFTAEEWVYLDSFNSSSEAWIPSLALCRDSAGSLTTFAGIIEPYEKASQISAIKPVSLPSEARAKGAVCIHIELASGEADCVLFSGVTSDPALSVPEADITLKGRVGWIRTRGGHVTHAAIAQGQRLSLGGFDLRLNRPVDFLEEHNGQVVSGSPSAVQRLSNP